MVVIPPDEFHAITLANTVDLPPEAQAKLEAVEKGIRDAFRGDPHEEMLWAALKRQMWMPEGAAKRLYSLMADRRAASEKKEEERVAAEKAAAEVEKARKKMEEEQEKEKEKSAKKAKKAKKKATTAPVAPPPAASGRRTPHLCLCGRPDSEHGIRCWRDDRVPPPVIPPVPRQSTKRKAD